MHNPIMMVYRAEGDGGQEYSGSEVVLAKLVS